MDKYDVILADPPWHFRVWSEDTGSGRSASSHYSTMDIGDICALDVPSITADNCALFLWCVWPSLFEYPERVLKSWGFEYKTIAWVWVKTVKDGSRPATGMGYYTRANTEPCLLAIKGRMPVEDRAVLSLIEAPRGKHSAKPSQQYDKIERLYPERRYLEMFARKDRDGWDAWGNEVSTNVEL